MMGCFWTQGFCAGWMTIGNSWTLGIIMTLKHFLLISYSPWYHEWSIRSAKGKKYWCQLFKKSHALPKHIGSGSQPFETRGPLGKFCLGSRNTQKLKLLSSDSREQKFRFFKKCSCFNIFSLKSEKC